MGSGDMSISAFARRSLLSVKALRLYDEMGLLRPNRIDPSSRYRYYSESQLETARLISLLRKLEVPLVKTAEIIALDSDSASQALAEWWRDEEDRVKRRKDLLQYIRGWVVTDDGEQTRSDCDYDISIRERPLTTYLYRSRHLHGPELPEFIGNSINILTQSAERYGGVVGQSVVMFHGLVDLDSDGPADVCLPIADGAVAKDEDFVRTESAHLQAYIVLSKHQVEFPQILQVYLSLRRWILHNGYTISGPPREQYLGSFDAAESNDPICEVAFPIQPTKGNSS